jgi:hypothetical protein
MVIILEQGYGDKIMMLILAPVSVFLLILIGLFIFAQGVANTWMIKTLTIRSVLNSLN